MTEGIDTENVTSRNFIEKESLRRSISWWSPSLTKGRLRLRIVQERFKEETSHKK